jgi:hypothetical protein
VGETERACGLFSVHNPHTEIPVFASASRTIEGMNKTRLHTPHRFTLLTILAAALLVLPGCSSSSEGESKEVPVVKITPAPENPADGSPELDVLQAVQGMPLDEATSYAQGVGFELRVVEIDGESLMVTEDYRTDRVNVVIENDIVTSAEIG